MIALALVPLLGAGDPAALRLEYALDPAIVDRCPDESRFRAELADRLGAEAFAQELRIRISLEGDTLLGTIQVVEANGEVVGSRELSAPSHDCRALVDALQTATSIALDPRMRVAPPSLSRDLIESTGLPEPGPTETPASSETRPTGRMMVLEPRVWGLPREAAEHLSATMRDELTRLGAELVPADETPDEPCFAKTCVPVEAAPGGAVFFSVHRGLLLHRLEARLLQDGATVDRYVDRSVFAAALPNQAEIAAGSLARGVRGPIITATGSLRMAFVNGGSSTYDGRGLAGYSLSAGLDGRHLALELSARAVATQDRFREYIVESSAALNVWWYPSSAPVAVGAMGGVASWVTKDGWDDEGTGDAAGGVIAGAGLRLTPFRNSRLQPIVILEAHIGRPGLDDGMPVAVGLEVGFRAGGRRRWSAPVRADRIGRDDAPVE